jgi:hypothetical protein
MCNHAARPGKAGPMQSPDQITPPGLPEPASVETSSRSRADLAYQAVTVAAILLILCSVWVF